ncbi:DUF3040 domain-containing protein [Nanchangia anserum]|uniref:DUF3040 domain-containing protein n=1 Tax=Nanchangia anserum TaxID=2692125 RepID=A0A8I0KV09_9ACTO|nr:DUF3040 domain-containing protein [Nanchangia anserum]MBD3690248.1 DUF3040 domain-containing protein [Nanchangia anserum]QOX82310.1 DUF3040 domain-containing protein [Nanchangia anserum]
MALSEYERQVLEQMEAQFRPTPVRGARVSPRVWAAMVVFLLVGLVLLVVGVSLPHQLASIAVAVVGFALMVAGLSLPFSRLVATRSSSAKAKRTRSSSFMDRQRDQWERRSRR